MVHVMATCKLKREFTEFMGVNLKADDINRNDVFASGGQNCMYGNRGEIKRFPVARNAHYSTFTPGAFQLQALQLYKFIGKRDSVEVEEIMGISGTGALATLTENNFNVVYTGSGTAEISIGEENGDTNKVYVYVDDVLVLTETAYYSSITVVRDAITALPDFTATVESINADMRTLFRTDRIEVGSDGVDIPYFVVDEKTSSGASINMVPPVADIPDSYLIGDSVSLNGILYFNDLDGQIIKYDSEYYYPAGLWKPSIVTLSLLGGGALVAGEFYTLAVRTKFVDYAGLTHYSAFQLNTREVGAGHNAIQIQGQHEITAPPPNLLRTSFTATGSGTVLPVLAGTGKFKIGDKLTANSFGIIETANVLAVTATTITVDSTIGYVSGEDCSHQYTVEVWSSTVTNSGGNEVGPYYKLGEVVSIDQVVNITRTVSDAVLTEYENETDIRQWNDGVPKGTKLTKFQNSLIMKSKESDSTVLFSDQSGQEQFDLATTNFIVDGSIKGIGATKEQLAVFKDSNCDVLSGDLQGAGVRIDRVDDDIGCVAHQTIQRLADGVIAFLSKKGPYKMVNGIISPLGSHTTKSGNTASRLEPWFTKNWETSRSSNPADRLVFADYRATSGHWSKKNIYLVHIPLENALYPAFDAFSYLHPNTWAYDYEKDAWLPQLDGYSLSAGAHENKRGEMLFLNHAISGGGNNQKYLGYVYHIQNSDDSILHPQITGRESTYSFSWMHFGAPSVFKKFNRIRIFSHEQTNGAPSFNVTVRAENDFAEGVYRTDLPGVTLTIGESRLVKLQSMKARSMRITIQSEEVGDWSINGLVVEWSQSYKGLK